MDPEQKDSSSPKESESPNDRASPKDSPVDADSEPAADVAVAADFAVAAEDEEPSAHVCGVCGRSFPLLSSLSQHMRRHTREKPYECPYCEHRTAQKGSLKAHVRSHKLGLLGRSPGPEGATTEGAPGCGEDASASAGEVADSSSEKEHGGVEGGAKKKKKVPKRKARRGDDDAEAAGEEESSGSSGGGGANAPEEGAGVGPFPCSVCSQVFPQAALLKAHAKKHKGAQDHGCRICGRRFRQAWFLQSHMRIHRATKAPLKGGGDGATQPATVNGAHRDPAALANEECLYELCAGCGNFFYDRRSLQAHEKLHKPGHGRGQAQTPPQQQQPDKPVDPEAVASKEDFLKSLNLRSVRSEEPAAEEKEPAGRIMELDPICSYQAWQIATKGRLVEVTERGLGWEERLADAEVAYNREKGEYVALKVDKKRKQGDAPAAPLKKKKAGGSQEHPAINALSGSNGGHHGQTDHTLFNGLGHAFYVALQKKKLKEEAQVSAKQNNSIRNQGQKDKKPLFCQHCDFHAVDTSSLRSHVCKPRPDQHSAPKGLEDHLRQSGSKDSKYMDYLRNRSALLSQPYWSPFASLPGQDWTELAVKKEKSEASEGAAGEGGTAIKPVPIDGANLINLSSLPVPDPPAASAAPAAAAADPAGETGGLVRHQCPYCAHTTNYPEVLWIHQRVAHRVDGASSVAPRWAPCLGGFKGSKAGAGGQWRRTGPPPFLEGKDCPALPAPRTQRTQAPEAAAPAPATASTATTGRATGRTATSAPGGTASSTTSTSSGAPGSGRRSTGKTQPGNPTAVKQRTAPAPSKDSRSSDGSPSSGRKMALLPPKKKSSSSERSQKGEEPGRSKSSAATAAAAAATVATAQAGSSSGSSAYPAHGGPAFRSTGSPKHRGHRVSVEGRLLPQEGLGFMLARNHVHSPSPHRSGGGHAPTRDAMNAAAAASAAAAKGRDLWSAMNMWGSQRDRGYAEPPLYAQGKSEAQPETPMDIDVLSLLKSYSPHDLAALYQHWGFVDPRIDPQAMLQLNGHFVNEVHSASEASRQVNSHTTSSSGSLQKGT